MSCLMHSTYFLYIDGKLIWRGCGERPQRRFRRWCPMLPTSCRLGLTTTFPCLCLESFISAFLLLQFTLDGGQPTRLILHVFYHICPYWVYSLFVSPQLVTNPVFMLQFTYSIRATISLNLRLPYDMTSGRICNSLSSAGLLNLVMVSCLCLFTMTSTANVPLHRHHNRIRNSVRPDRACAKSVFEHYNMKAHIPVEWITRLRVLELAFQ
jgi:hypothetical protein